MQKNYGVEKSYLIVLLCTFIAISMLYVPGNAFAGQQQPKNFMQAVKLGRQYYKTSFGFIGKSCETCHTIADITGKGGQGSLVPIPPFPATYYPKFKKTNIYSGKKIPYSLQDQIRHCILRGEEGFKYGPHSKVVEYLDIYLTYISNGHKIHIPLKKSKKK